MADMILFPSDFFDSTKVDEDLEQEYEAVKATKLFETVLFDYDKWFNEGKLVIKHKPEKEHNAVYRGWMMKPEQYELFYHKLNENNINLITKPDEYSFMHIFPNVYESIKNDTAKIMVFPLHSDINVEQLKESFDRFMVKDYVKSEKGTEFPAYFDKNMGAFQDLCKQ